MFQIKNINKEAKNIKLIQSPSEKNFWSKFFVIKFKSLSLYFGRTPHKHLPIVPFPKATHTKHVHISTNTGKYSK